jgi:hypothetical protein
MYDVKSEKVPSRAVAYTRHPLLGQLAAERYSVPRGLTVGKRSHLQHLGVAQIGNSCRLDTQLPLPRRRGC